jgi:hypothetical protein
MIAGSSQIYSAPTTSSNAEYMSLLKAIIYYPLY